MRKAILTGLAVTSGLAVAVAGGALAGTSSGQGAQMSSMGPASGSMNNCATSSGSNGWSILNDPGKVGAVRFTNGEVHLVGGAPNTTYMIALGSSSGGACTLTTDTLTTNGQGIGNGHITVAPAVTGTAFVALFQGSNEAFASSPVPLQ